jgi:hypothetical protein
MPWQQRVLDVGLEIDPKTGFFAYREVVVTVPRQQGKTAGVVLPLEIDRCTMWDKPQRVIYTAQTGSDARKKLIEDQVPVIKGSSLAKLIQKLHQAQGNEGILFRNGSRIGLAASSQDAGHGFTVDLGILDECWRDEDDRREQAMIPAMNTRPWAQLWLTSTQGTDASTYLNRKVEIGRHAATVDKGSGVAYFEWSIPEDADIEDPEVWWEAMPALGWTIQPSVVAYALETMEEAEWRRAFGNQPTRTKHDRIFSADAWERVCDVRVEVNRGKPVVFAVDVLPDRSASAIAASDGENVELVEHRSGTNWLPERVKEILSVYRGTIAVDGGGPAASIADDMEMLGLEVERMSGSEVAAACAFMYDAVADKRLKIRKDTDLDEAVSGLAKRPIGDRFVWSRSTSRSDITPFMAATIAYERANHGEDKEVAFYSFS